MDTKSQTAPAHTTEVTTTEARQGQTGLHVRAVLGFGLTGVVIAFAIVYVVFFA